MLSASSYNESDVVILEDDDFVTQEISQGLWMFGYRGVGVKTKEEVYLAREGGARNFVLDVSIRSRPDGLEALEKIKNFNPHVQAYIYSNHLEKLEYRHRAERLKADLVLEKRDTRKDVLIIVNRLLTCQRSLNARRLEQIKKELGSTSSVEGAFVEADPDSPENDSNIRLYDSLIQNDDWRRSNSGKVVGIVDGRVVCIESELQDVMIALRSQYPSLPKFVKRIEVDDDQDLDVPTPLDVEDIVE